MLRGLKIGFIGWGKMAEAMISRLLSLKLIHPKRIIATGTRTERGRVLAKAYGIKTNVSNNEATKADIIILAVKPDMMAMILGELAGKIKSDALIISIAAGVQIATISERLKTFNVARAMPNIATLVGQGTGGWSVAAELSLKHTMQATSIMDILGCRGPVEEKHLDVITAGSGCGPAHLAAIAKARIDAMVAEGLDRDFAEELEIHTLESLIAIRKAGMSLDEIIAKVSTSGGATEAGFVELNKAIPILHDTIRAATQRCREMSK